MSTIGWIHTALALAAIAFGAIVLFRRKGTFSHRLIGYGYVASMIGLNATALSIYRLTGYFGPFHVAAIVSLGTTLAGAIVAWRRSDDWVRKHYMWMTYSYVGLLAATASEVLTRLPSAPFWGAVAIATIAVFVAGAWMIRRSERATIGPFTGAMSAAPRTPLFKRQPSRYRAPGHK